MKKLFTIFCLSMIASLVWAQDHTVETSGLTFVPADITINLGETIEWVNTGGGHNVNGSQATFPSNPESFDNGAISSSLWTFQHTFNTVGTYDYQCDPHAGAGMVGTVTVMGGMMLPEYPIGLVTGDSDGDGITDSLGVECSLTGVVHGVDLNGGASVQFTMIGSDGEGIGIFSSNDYGYTVLEGDEITIEGSISNFNGLAQISPDTIILNSAGNTLATAAVVTALDETTESQLVTIENVSIVDTLGNFGGYNIRITNGTDTFIMRLDNGVDLYNSGFPTAPTFNVTGLGGQFNSDYQILPRYTADIEEVVPVSSDMVISGIYDSQPSNLGPRGIELYVINDIPDLSIYGFGSANNGGGSDGLEFTLPAVSASAGDCIYLTQDSLLFIDFFGFSPNRETGFASINGDDAVELFKDSVVVDIFGDINVDGNGEPWEYVDGWAYRKSGTGPDGSTFVLDNWTFSGVDGLDGGGTNANSPTPYQNCTYSPIPPTDIFANDDAATVPQSMTTNIDIIANDQTPNGVTSISIVSMPANGMAVANGTTDVSYTPNAGFCGSDAFVYEVCDANLCSQATVSIEMYCSYPIGLLTADADGDGVGDSLGVAVEITGVVYGVDLQGAANDAIQFTIIGSDNEGIGLFSNDNFGYTVTEGDEVTVWGTISQFRGLTQINPVNLMMNSAGNPLVTPTDVTALDETTESQLIRITNATIVDPSQWTGSGAGFNVDITDGTNTYNLRIDSDVDLYSAPAPTGTLNITGIGGQFDFDAPYNEGYQILPRYTADIEEIIATNDLELGSKIQFSPNPVSDLLQIKSEIELDQIRVTNMLGQEVKNIHAPQLNEFLNVNSWQSGVYVITFIAEDRIFTAQFVKQ